MDQHVAQRPRRHRPQPRRHRRVRLLALGLVALGLLASACSSGGSSGSGVANVGSSTTPGHSSSTKSAKPSALAYALCMRSHGIPSFPEPNGSGSIQIQKGQSLPDLNSPQVQTAEEACRSLNAAGAGPTPAQQAQQLAAEVKYARCMRSHGVSNFPDPFSQNGLSFQGVDVNSPQVIAANKACATAGAGLNAGGRTGP
jgi:hypothetical protein